ncbi:hypothetical protein D3C85_1065160 [compost metagenome]
MGVDLAALALQQSGIEAEGRHHVGHVALTLAQGFTRVESFQPRQPFAIGLDGIGDLAQDRGPFADAQPGPVALIEGPTGGVDSRCGIRCAGHRHLRQHVLVGGVDHRPQTGLSGVTPAAVDKELVDSHGTSPVFVLKVVPLSADSRAAD